MDELCLTVAVLFFCFLHMRDHICVLIDPLVQISIDESRNVLYTRSEKGSIQVSYDNVLTAHTTDAPLTMIFQVMLSSWLSLMFLFFPTYLCILWRRAIQDFFRFYFFFAFFPYREDFCFFCQ